MQGLTPADFTKIINDTQGDGSSGTERSITEESNRRRAEKERKKNEKAEAARLKKEEAAEKRKIKREEAAEKRRIKREEAAEKRRITREEHEFLRSLNKVHRELITKRRNEQRDTEKAEKYYRSYSVSGLYQPTMPDFPCQHRLKCGTAGQCQRR